MRDFNLFRERHIISQYHRSQFIWRGGIILKENKKIYNYYIYNIYIIYIVKYLT